MHFSILTILETYSTHSHKLPQIRANFFFFCLFTSPYHTLEKGMAGHSSILAWRIPWTEEPGGLNSP